MYKECRHFSRSANENHCETPLERGYNQKKTITNGGEGVEQTEPFYRMNRI